eukprot:8073711-Alexandrium_andersonii.AAC.1
MGRFARRSGAKSGGRRSADRNVSASCARGIVSEARSRGFGANQGASATGLELQNPLAPHDNPLFVLS